MHLIVAVMVALAGALWWQAPVALAGEQATGAQAAPYVPPRTPWGDPDLQGAYTNSDESLIPLERPESLSGRSLDDITPEELERLVEARHEQRIEADRQRWQLRSPLHWFENHNPRNSRAWLVVDPPDGRVPPTTDEARARAAARAAARRGRGEADSYEDRSLFDRCITRGLPGSMMPAIYGNAYEIVQGPGYVAIRYEMINETRVIPLDGRPHAGAAIRMYMGDGRGRFEGDTLVIETTNFTDRTAYRNSSEHLRLIERFTPVAPGIVEWSVTFDDAATWTRPWTFAMHLTQVDERPFEYACHEGNYAMRYILGIAREEERAAAGAQQAPAPPPAAPPQSAAPAPAPQGQSRIVRLDPALDALVPAGAVIERVATGFAFTEGPVWTRDGALLFSDIPANAIVRVTPAGETTVFRTPSGFDGTDARPGSHVGSNGLTIDREGRLLIAEHGNRRVTRLEPDGRLTVIADRYDGRRLNSPNDIVVKSDGTIYFTDPPYGLPQQDKDPAKEIEWSGIYRVRDGRVELLSRDLSRPNGLAFSPDERYLYVANSEPARRIWMRYDVRSDGTLENGTVFLDLTADEGRGIPDGFKVDVRGNLYLTGPGGVIVVSPQGTVLGRIETPEGPANVGWGDDGRTLYITARTSVYRVRLNVGGPRPCCP
jgi:sugar lactone lactonase YvrE